MSRKKVYGRSYPISNSDVKAYRRVERNGQLRANPIGVTAMSSVNGRGSYQSARAVAEGKTRGQRIARAEQIYRNGESVMLRNRKRSGSATRTKAASKKRTSRRKVPGTAYYRTSGGRYQNSRGKFVSATAVESTSKRTSRKSPTSVKRRTTAKRRVKRNKSVGYSPAYSAGHDRMKRSEAGKKAARTRKRRQAVAAKTTRKPTAGKYRRVRLSDPSSGGRKKLSYMYRTKGGKLRKIPTRAILKSGMTSTAMKRKRAKAAARVKREGSAFVANRSGKSSARQKRAGRRWAAYLAAKRSGKTVVQARGAALRKVPLARGDQFKGVAKAPVTTTKRRTKVKRNAKRRTKKRTTTAKKTTRRTVAARRRTAVVRRRAKKRTTARRRVRRNGNTTTMRNSRRKVTANRRRKVTANRRRKVTPNRRRVRANRRRKVTANRRSFRKNDFMGNLKAAFTTGLFVTTGFLTHRVLTNVVCDNLLGDFGADNQALLDWKKPLCGVGVLALGIPLVGAVAPKRGIELGAGMVASFLQSVIVAALNSAGQQNLVGSVAGYSNSRAYALRGARGRRRRGTRGFERHATSIMPRYTPVRSMGQYQQAAAGQFQQAAAGRFQQAAAGEYFSASPGGTGEYFTATGEYFAPQGMKGVGGYEPAGELAMQASAGTNQVIRDGLRPDDDIDYALDVAEAAAGLGDPTAVEHRVPRQSQWIPNGPLWAGERPVADTQATSEISAGILQRPGGNGVLSGG